MDNTTTVSGFNTTKNRIMGRLSQCTDPAQLKRQLELEAIDLLPDIPSPKIMRMQEKAALVGIDISQGIQAANDCIDGNTEKIDSL